MQDDNKEERSEEGANGEGRVVGRIRGVEEELDNANEEIAEENDRASLVDRTEGKGVREKIHDPLDVELGVLDFVDARRKLDGHQGPMRVFERIN
jgi:hypothetical protein